MPNLAQNSSFPWNGPSDWLPGLVRHKWMFEVIANVLKWNYCYIQYNNSEPRSVEPRWNTNMTFRGGNNGPWYSSYIFKQSWWNNYKTPTLSQVNVHPQRKDAIDNILAFQVCAAIVHFTIYGRLSEKMSQEIGSCYHYSAKRRKICKTKPVARTNYFLTFSSNWY